MTFIKKNLFGAILKFGGNLDFLEFRREIFYNVELRTQSFQELSDGKAQVPQWEELS